LWDLFPLFLRSGGDFVINQTRAKVFKVKEEKRKNRMAGKDPLSYKKRNLLGLEEVVSNLT
jgi:hypothetical protein